MAGIRYRISPLSIRETATTYSAPIASATVTVYLAGTTTAATCYADTTTGTPLASSQTTTNSAGYFEFFVDSADYANTQKFKIVISKTGYSNITYDYLNIFPNLAGVRDPYIDVRAYGAVGDGMTDDTAAVTNAIAAGGEIFFPAGTYKLNTITIDATTGLKLRGAGMGDSILDFSAVTSADGLEITYDSPDAGGSKLISIHDLQMKDSRGSGLSTVTNLIRIEGGNTGASPSDTSAFIDIQRVYASQHNNTSGTIMLVRNVSQMAIRDFYTQYQPEAQYGLVIDNDVSINTGVMTIENCYLQGSKTGLYIHQTANLLDTFAVYGNFIANYTNSASREAVRLEGDISALDFRGNHIEARDYTDNAAVVVTGTLTASSFASNHFSCGTGSGPSGFAQFGIQFTAATLRGVSLQANEFLRVKPSGSSGALYRFENDCNLSVSEPVNIAGVYRNSTTASILSVETGGSENAIWNGLNIHHNEAKRSLGNIADNDVVVIAPPYSEGILLIRTGNTPSASGLITFRAENPSGITGLGLGTDTVVGTGALTQGIGDGTDTKLNINAHTDGNLYIKNMLGYAATFYITYKFS